MYVSQDEVPISGGDTAYPWSCEEAGITSQSDQLVGASEFTQ